jgi:4-amino-4-deoxy-L-arabinose transferase-like glycosyltransferase
MTAGLAGDLVAPRRVLAGALATSKWVLPAIFAGGLLVRLLVILFFPQEPISDGAFYFSRAAEMAAGLGYNEEGAPTAFWPVGYPALLAGAMLIFGKTLVAPAAVNLVSAAAILWLVLWFGRRLTGSEVAARLAALLYAVYPAHIAYTGTTLSETSYTAVTMGAFAILVGRRHRLGWMALAGLLFGFATLMRPQTMLFPAGALIALVLVTRDFRWKDALKAGLVLHLVLAATVLPWSLRNQRVFGEFVWVSTNAGVALYTGANEQANGDYFAWERGPLWDASGIPFAQRVTRQVELDRRFQKLATDWIKENPGRYLAMGPKKAALLWHKDSDGFWGLKNSHPRHEATLTALQWLNQGFYALILLLSAFCFAIATRALLRREDGTMLLGLLFCMPVFSTLLAFFFTGQIRYHYPAMPFLMVAAAWTLLRLAEKVRGPSAPQQATLVAA